MEIREAECGGTHSLHSPTIKLQTTHSLSCLIVSNGNTQKNKT